MKRKKIITFILITYLMCIFYNVNDWKNDNYKIQAADSNSIRAVNLLTKNWKPYYNNGSGSIVESGTVLSDKWTEISTSWSSDVKGAAQVTADTVSLQVSTGYLILKQNAIQIKSGQYYQFRGVLKASTTVKGALSEYQFKITNIWDRELKQDRFMLWDGSSKEVVYSFKASGDAVNLEFYNFGMTETNVATSATGVVKNPSFTDITDEVNGITASVDALFTDKNQTALKLSVTQKKITEIKKTVNEIKELLDAKVVTGLETKLTKAQTLLDAVNTQLTIENLVDNLQDVHSNTIIGVTYPNAFLNFSGRDDIPKGTLSSEVEGDSRTYQIRADGTGKFRYSLPKDSHFQYPEKIMVVSMLHGKSTVQTKTVLDTTPPAQPTLEGLKDTDKAFSGTGEKDSVIKVYDSNMNTLFLEGTATTDGAYSLTIPSDKQPLVPYTNYYVTATDISGNVSEKSGFQEVADTTAPKADPVKQVLTLGEALPSLDKLIVNLYDNAGSQHVNVSLTKAADLSKVGFSTAELTLMDKAKNTSKIIVPIFVKDLETIDDGEHMLYAADFTSLAIDFPDKSEEQIRFLLKNSQAGVWQTTTGENKTDQLTVDHSSMRKSPGTYKVTFSLGELKKKITVTLSAGKLDFDQVAAPISFGMPTIKSETQEIYPQKSVDFLIDDSRFLIKDWRLMAKLTQPLQTKSGKKTKTTINLRKHDANNQLIEQPLSDQMTTELYSDRNGRNGKIPLRFNQLEQQALYLNVLPGTVLSNEEYGTQIVWTLENGP
ncbi:Ig-like domain-containing protein [Enterococcus rotai]|uniref:Ig-like domain-containing protein n=1 Tax=Enterococcus rotai TaxID=118060 RepID=UPI0032B501DE